MTKHDAIKSLSHSISSAKIDKSMWVDNVNVNALEIAVRAMADEREKGTWTTHEVACLLAEVIGDDCACNVNGNDEWLPFECIFAQRECPNVGVACWEQWLVHRKEKQNEQTN